MSIDLILEHLFIVLAACILSVLIGLPLGITAYMQPRLRALILRIVDLLQTIPALALLGIIMVFLGAGKPTVIVGITLYSLLPIVRNTCLGLQQVDSGVKEAARGMGMSRAKRLLQVELPLAFPTVFTGIRIAVVSAIGTAVFAAFVGGGGLGSIITRGIRVQDVKLILMGTGALMIIAIAIDFLMSRFEAGMKSGHSSNWKMWAPVGVTLVAFLCLLPFGFSHTNNNELRLYDGDYSEPQLIHRMVRDLVEDRTSLTVTLQDQMSQVNNFKALIGNDASCDLMCSYDGTILTTFLHQDMPDVPEGTSMRDYVTEEISQQYNLRLLDPLGFNNTYAIAVPQNLAEKYHLETISDLIPLAPNLSFGAEHEFFTLEGNAKYGPFVDFYGLNFKETKPVDVSLKYAAAEKGAFDVTMVFATDGLNRKTGLKILEDDRHFFPDYIGGLLIREDTLEHFQEKAPELEEVLNLLANAFTNEDIVDLTYQVDVEGQDPDIVAHQALIDRGLIAK